MQLQRRLLQWKLAKETLTRQIKLIHRGRNQKLYVFVPRLAGLRWRKFLLSCDRKSLSPLKTQWTPRLPCCYRKARCLVIWMWKIFQMVVWRSCSWVRLETRLWEFPEIPQKKNIDEERCYQTMERSDECALMHEGIKPELYKGTSKLVSLEFDEYLKSNSVIWSSGWV